MKNSAGDLQADPGTLQGFDIVCLGTVEWLAVPGASEHTVLRLARRNRVLFVQPFNALSTLFHEACIQRRHFKATWGVRQIGPTLWVYAPPPIGMPGSSHWRWPAEVNGWILSRLLKRTIQVLGFVNPLLWTYMCNSAPVVRYLKPCLSIHDCIDKIHVMARSEHQRRLVQEREAALCREVDIVFGVTEGMVNARRPFNPNTFEVNNAGDFEHFGKARSASTVVPPSIAELPRPVVGYIGGLDPWRIDISIIQGIAKARPQWSIALVGPVWHGFDPAAFLPFPNIHLLGMQRHADLPNYLKGIDVCITPFKLNEFTLHGDAMKCYEYLTAGKPVVSTPVPSALRLSSVVRIADNPAAFLSAIEASLTEEPSAAERRLEAVKSHTWEDRVAQKSRIVLKRLGEKTGQ
jgi:glycosyltransferase involved in cell wall biosynthesis